MDIEAPDLSAKALIATVAVAYVAALVGFPAYERYFRGSYDKAAQAIIARADGIPIYSVDDTSVRLSIVANINALRAPASPVTRPPPQFESGFVLSLNPDSTIGQVVTTFAIGRDPVGTRTRYLLCRGKACFREGISNVGPLSFHKSGILWSINRTPATPPMFLMVDRNDINNIS